MRRGLVQQIYGMNPIAAVAGSSNIKKAQRGRLDFRGAVLAYTALCTFFRSECWSYSFSLREFFLVFETTGRNEITSSADSFCFLNRVSSECSGNFLFSAVATLTPCRKLSTTQ